MDEDRLTDDLVDTLVILEMRYPDASHMALFCAIQEGAAERQIAVIVADTDSRFATKLSGPVVDDACRCLAHAGYEIRWIQNASLEVCLDVRRRPISQHRRLMAVGRFLHLFP